jgi:uncharacterized protein YoxC
MKDTMDTSVAEKTAEKAGRRSNPGDEHMERLARTFENSARRWEMVVYPAMIAFIVLAIYGFYLIFSLTKDVASLARNVTVLTSSIDRMTNNMDSIVVNMNSIATNMVEMDDKMGELRPIRLQMEQMNHATHSMAMSAEGMHNQMGNMSYSMRPLGKMGGFMPW